MIVEVTVPSVGESINEGILAVWSVADGQYVEKGATLFELETDKASTEVPAPESGVVKQKAQEGDEIEIGSVVATINTDAEAPAESASSADTSAPEPAKKEKTPPPEPTLPAEPAQDDDDGEGPRILATSVARKIAHENKIDLAQIQGTGAGGRITREDVESRIQATQASSAKAAPAPKPPAAKPAPAPKPVAPKVSVPDGPDVTRERMTTLRRRIAERLVEAQHTAAMLTTFNDVDMSAVMELRKQYKDKFKETHGVGLGFMSFFTRAAAKALKEFPRVNAMIDGSDIVYHHRYHIGVAVSTERGLVVPVVRDADRLSFAEIEKTIMDYAIKGRDGKLDIKDMQGGTFTISNGGVFGSMLSTPILNPPQSAILGMHRIEERPVARNGQVVIRPMMYLALSYDHRIIDGKEAVTFLVRIKEAIEDPARLLLDV